MYRWVKMTHALGRGEDGDEEEPVWQWTGPIHDSDPLLHQASYLGDVNKVQELLQDSECGKMINTKNRLGCTPLRLAATAGHIACVAALIEAGAEVNIPDVKSQTPLYVAVKNHHLECLKQLLDCGANPNGDANCLCTPLYIASMDGYIDGVKELVKHGADLDTSQIHVGSFISTPLYISIAYQRLDCFKALLQAGADPDYGCEIAIMCKRHLPNCQSLFHAVVLKSCSWQFAELLRNFGANLWIRDDKGRLAVDLPEENSECKSYLLSVIGQPLCLTYQCRIQVRRYLGRTRLPALQNINLPKKIVDFLEHND